ncbi:MAG: hypothetical protein ACI8TQ_001122 [Planctomycetota bacterium]|jgi:hypothetical protein
MRSGYKYFAEMHANREVRAGDRSILDEYALQAFGGDSLAEKLARELAHESAIPIKELFESFEFYARVRKWVRAPNMADLCCGHGLTGVLFALFDRKVDRVVLIDQVRPPSFDKVRAAAIRVGPWVEEKLEYREGKLKREVERLEPGTSILGVHACGLRTDQCIDAALRLRSKVAVMPCCYPAAHCSAPATLIQHLGVERAFDIDRTYRLERAGYRVRWDAIPDEITPMSRVLVGLPLE